MKTPRTIASSLSLVAIAMLALTSCSNDAPAATEAAAPLEFEASGYVSVPYHQGMTMIAQTIFEIDSLKEGEECAIDSSYSDLGAGSQLVIRSSDGTVLGSTELEEPYLKKEHCQLRFALEGVDIQEDDIYEIAVGRDVRETLIASQAELESGDFGISLN